MDILKDPALWIVIAFFALLFGVNQCQADEYPSIVKPGWSVTGLIGSHHTDWDEEFDPNEDNPGLIVGYDNYRAGCYENSYSRTSCLIAYEATLHNTKYLDMGVGVGLVSGYEDDEIKSGGILFTLTVTLPGAKILHLPGVGYAYGLHWEQ